MKLLIYSSILVLFFYAHSSFAANKMIAEVIKIRGSVTKLLPGSTIASVVVLGDQFPEDTSLVTGPKSFIKIKFSDNSELNMGPESKIVISEMKNLGQPGIISLLKGKIRTQVEKGNQIDGHKLFIRTRTAALGVRGTDFQTIYNPDNKMTSLLTYKGAVAMAKLDKETHKALEEGVEDSTKEISRSDVSKVPVVEEIPGKQINEKVQLQKLLDTKDVVVVAPGQNAFASDALKKSSLPVKISPLQLNALYKNAEFQEKDTSNIRSALELKNIKMEVSQAPQAAPIEGVYNAITGEYAPKAGGFIDQETGLYIAPDASAVLDSATGTYRSEKNGDIDADTGQYIAPQGLVLDAKRGFILKDQVDVKPQLLALREDLNKTIARDLVVGDLDGEVILDNKNIKERFIRDRLTFTFMVGDEDIKLNKNKNLPYSEFSSKDLVAYSIDWQMSSTNRFAPLLGFGYKEVDYEKIASAGHRQDSNGLFNSYLGLKYSLSKRFNLYSKLLLEQGHFADKQATFPENYFLRRAVTTKFGIGSDAHFFKGEKFNLVVDAMVALGFRKRLNNLVIGSGAKYMLKIMPEWKIGDKKFLGFGFSRSSESYDLSNSLGKTYQERNNNSLFLSYGVDL